MSYSIFNSSFIIVNFENDSIHMRCVSVQYHHWQSSMNHYLRELYLSIIIIIVCQMILHAIWNIIIKTCSMFIVHGSVMMFTVYDNFFLLSFLWLFSAQYEFRWRLLLFAMEMVWKCNICYHIIYPILYSWWKPILFADTIFLFSFFPRQFDSVPCSMHCSINKSAINI